jgi:glycosyltransferase involved in cell wall biosynthesis
VEGAGSPPAPFHLSVEADLKRAAALAEAGDFPGALRWADRASRYGAPSPDLTALKAQLKLRTGDAAGALVALGEPVGDRLDLYRLKAEALISLERWRSALAVLRAAIVRFAIPEHDPIVSTLRAVCAGRSASPGWLAVAPDLTLWGEVRGDSLDVRVGGAPLRARLRPAGEDELIGFSLIAPSDTAPMQASSGGSPLLGGERDWPPDYRLDGRCSYRDRRLTGWVSLGWAPPRRPALRLEIGRERIELLSARDLAPGPDGRHTFDLSVPALAGHDSGRILAQLPDGRWAELPSSPVVLRLPPAPTPIPVRPAQGAGSRRRGRARPHSAQPLASTVPTRRGAAVVIRACGGQDGLLTGLSALRATLGRDTPLVVLDDASVEPELSAALQDLAAGTGVKLLASAEPPGLAASVNRAARLHPDHDLVIFDPHAQAFPGWFERLREAAYAAPDVGTATPFSNGGDLARYPRRLGPAITPDGAAGLDRLADEVNAGLAVDAPTAAGACVYIRRDCWDATGELDVRLFRHGDGAVDDFCARASRFGWRHRIAADVYVRSSRKGVDGGAADADRERDILLLAERHSGYLKGVSAFLDRDPLHVARRRLDEIQLIERFKPVTLLVTLALPGGVGRVVDARRTAIRASGGQSIVLKPLADGEALRLELDDGAQDQDLVYRLDEQQALLTLLRALPIERVEVHHTLGLPDAVVDAVLELGQDRIFYIHDYALICPRITLMDGSRRYCGEPPPEVCDRCVAENGRDVPFDGSTVDYRRRSGRWLARTDAVAVPCEDVLDRIDRYYPEAPLHLTPWERSTYPATQPINARPAVVRVAIIGAIGEHKGFDRLIACAKDAAARRLAIEFVVIGFTLDDQAWAALPNTFATGRYTEEELPDLLAREAPQVALFASVWPETWCFALSHALEAGLPVVAFDIGAPAERLRATETTHILLPLESPAEVINNALLDLVLRPPVVHAPPSQAPAVATAVAQPIEADAPAGPTEHEPETRPMTDASLGLTASVQLVTLNKGLYSFRVQAAPPTRVGDAGDVLLPALKVGVAPGVSADSVEILDGIRGDGGWLFEPTDMLVAKVKVSGTAVMITSYTARDLPRLAIEVERLDGRRTESTQAAAPPPPAPPQPMAAPALPSAVAPPLPAPAAAVSSGGARYAPDGRRRLPIRVDAHVSMVGDVGYTDPDWAGELARKLPLEAFSITPLEGLSAEDIEYKAVTARGTETAWIRGGEACGARRTATPLSGIAVRLRGPKAAQYELSYRGRFRSGAEVGPCPAGTPLKGGALSDYLLGFQLTIVEALSGGAEEEDPVQAAANGGRPVQEADGAARPSDGLRSARPVGPRFSVFRQEEA